MKNYIQKGLVLSIFLAICVSTFAQQLTPYRKGELWGYADKQGNIKIKCKYDKASIFKEGVAYVSKADQKAIINSKGKEILPLNNWLTFSRIRHQDAFMVINNLRQYGVINIDGKMLVPFGKYEKMESFNKHGISQVKNANLFGAVNYLGNEVLPLDSYQVIYLDMKSDYLYVKKNNKAILLSPKGELLSNKKYDNIFRLKETSDYFATLNDGLLGIIDAKGQQCLPNIYEDIYYGNEDTFRVQKNELWAYVTNQNKIISQEKYDAIEPFENSFAKVIKKGKYGVIDKDGKLIVDFNKYDAIQSFKDGFFIVKKEGKYGIVNQDGKEIVTPNKYQNISGFNGGFAIVSENGRYGMINTKGKEIKTCKFDEIQKVNDQAFVNTLFVKDTLYISSKKVVARFKENGKFGLLNAKGKLLLKAEYQKIDLTYAHQNLLVAKQDAKSNKTLFGYYNTDKETFTTPVIYKDAKPFKNKQFYVAEVQLQNNKRTALNTVGKQVVVPEFNFQKIKQINKQTLLIKSNNFSFALYNILQRKYSVPLGKYTILTPSKDTQFFCVGSKVKDGNRKSVKYGIINTTGKEITPLKYDKIEGEFIGDFVKNNTIEVKLDRKKGYIDTNGKEFFK